MAANSRVLGFALLTCLAGSPTTGFTQEAAKVALFDAKSEVDRFITTVDFRMMKQEVSRWSQGATADDRKRLVLELAARLTNPREIGLTGYADTGVYSRLATRKMRPHGHGTIMLQDIFLENGRCAWAIEQIIGCRLREFSVEVGASEAKLAAAVRTSLLRIIAAMEIPAPRPAPEP